MDIQIIIITLIVAGIFILPFFISSKSGKKNEKELHNALTKLANSVNGSIQRYEIWGDFALGLDEKLLIAFFIRKSTDSFDSNIVKLSEITQCIANNIYVTINKEDNLNYVDKLEIIFKQKDKSIPDTIWEIYNSDHFRQITGEISIVENWVFIFNQQLRKNKLK